MRVHENHTASSPIYKKHLMTKDKSSATLNVTRSGQIVSFLES